LLTLFTYFIIQFSFLIVSFTFSFFLSFYITFYLFAFLNFF